MQREFQGRKTPRLFLDGQQSTAGDQKQWYVTTIPFEIIDAIVGGVRWRRLRISQSKDSISGT